MNEKDKQKLEQLISSIPADLRYPVIYDQDGNKVATGSNLYEHLMFRDLKQLFIEDVKTRFPLLGKFFELQHEGKDQEAVAFAHAHEVDLEKEYAAHVRSLAVVRFGYTCTSINGLRATLEYTPYSVRNEEWERTDAWREGIPFALCVNLNDMWPGHTWHPVVGRQYSVLFTRTPGGRLFVLQPYRID